MSEYAIIRTNGMDAIELGRFKLSEFEHLILQAQINMNEDKDLCPMCKTLYYKIETMLDELDKDKQSAFWRGENINPEGIKSLDPYTRIQEGKDKSGDLLAGDRRI